MTDIQFATSASPTPQDDMPLVGRIRRSYQLAVATPLGSTESMWLRGPLFDMRRDVHQALSAENPAEIAGMLRRPGQTDLHYGFEDLNRTSLAERLSLADPERFAGSEFLGLLELCRAAGLYPVRLHDRPEPPLPPLAEMLSRLDRLFGFRLAFPNPFPDEPGLATPRGVLSYRVPPALYQAMRLRQLTRHRRAPRVLEIGGGLGRTAFYAAQFGITDYTIVDLPITLVAQANFLGRILGPDAVALHGEDVSVQAGVKLLPPSEFLASRRQYDVVLNVDSMTEMARDTAQAYCDAIQARATTFLSINHEGLGFTIAELMPGGMFQRSPYWMRPGYVEELAGQYPHVSGGQRLRRTMRRAASRGKAMLWKRSERP